MDHGARSRARAVILEELELQQSHVRRRHAGLPLRRLNKGLERCKARKFVGRAWSKCAWGKHSLSLSWYVESFVRLASGRRRLVQH